MRFETSEAQVSALMDIIRSIKPEWYDENGPELPYAYQDESCIKAVHDIYTKANRAWENSGDWNAALNEAAKDERIPQRKPIVVEGAPVLTEEEFKEISEKMDTTK